MARNDNVSFVGPARTGLRLLTIDRGAEEVCAWVLARRIDIVVFGVFAHRVRVANCEVLFLHIYISL